MCTLNITNGDAFNGYFINTFGAEALPFCEAMMDGSTVEDIFSEQFISVRASSLGVSDGYYKQKMELCQALKRRYSRLCLWFGEDTFCQMNLLTLLAYLEQIDYKGSVILNIIDDESFNIICRDLEVKLGIYKKLYKDILISKINPEELGVISKSAVDLYFDYHSKNGALARKVRENADMNDAELICLLLNCSREYGLSDLQAQELINRYKK